MNYLLKGDCHGRFFTFGKLDYDPKDTAIIILGDAGLNFTQDMNDLITKEKLSTFGYKVYCVRGNHDMRPEDVEGMELYVDKEIEGVVYKEKDYPLIHYLIDGEVYSFNGVRTGVLGGAYSVDKDYRLRMGMTWIENEQLTDLEFGWFFDLFSMQPIDLILSHTCPYDWRPTDLFLKQVDQSTVDNSSEKWLQKFADELDWKAWCFGHFHDDRALPHTEKEQYRYMLFNKFIPLEDVMEGKSL